MHFESQFLESELIRWGSVLFEIRCSRNRREQAVFREGGSCDTVKRQRGIQFCKKRERCYLKKENKSFAKTLL
jgi:hypothetical protein